MESVRDCRTLGRLFVAFIVVEILIIIGYKNKLFTFEDNKSSDRSKNSYRVEFEEQQNRSVADELAAKVRVLCWVMTSPNNREQARHVKATWGKRCNKLLFMSSAEDKTLPAVQLSVEEGPDHLWGKTKAAFYYVYQNYRDEADWFLKADDDTYVIVENLRYMLAKYDTNEPLYFGCRFKLNNQSYMSGGAGYVLSGAALDLLATEGLSGPHLCKWHNVGIEDTLFGKCMNILGVKFVDTRDSRRRGRFYPFLLHDHMFPRVTKHFWYFEYVYYSPKNGIDCCSDLAISFHYVSPQHMHELEYYVYRLRPFGINYNTRVIDEIPKNDKRSDKHLITGKLRKVTTESAKGLTV